MKNFFYTFFLLVSFIGQSSCSTSSFTPWWQTPGYKDNNAAINKHGLELLENIEQKIRTPNKNRDNQDNSNYPHFDQLKSEHKKLILNFFGLPLHANLTQIKTSFNKLCKYFHPDRNGDEKAFKKLKVLYDEICNTDNKYYESPEEILRKYWEQQREEMWKKKQQQEARRQAQARQEEIWRQAEIRRQAEAAARTWHPKYSQQYSAPKNFANNSFQARNFGHDQQEKGIDLFGASLLVIVIVGYLTYSLWPSPPLNLALLMRRFTVAQEITVVAESQVNSDKTNQIMKYWYTDISYRPLISFTEQELQIITNHSKDNYLKSLCNRHINALHGVGSYTYWGRLPHLGGYGRIHTLDSIENGCKLLSQNLFDTVYNIINAEFMNKVEAKGKELSLLDEKQLFHKLEAATIVVETAREYFGTATIEPKRKACMTKEQIDAEEEFKRYQIKAPFNASNYNKFKADERATQDRLNTLAQEIITEFRTALAEKLAPFMSVTA